MKVVVEPKALYTPFTPPTKKVVERVGRVEGEVEPIEHGRAPYTVSWTFQNFYSFYFTNLFLKTKFKTHF